MATKKTKIMASSTAEYFAKNLQQVGFSSPTKAVLTTLKEAVDNALDACEDHDILPDIAIEIKKVGKGSTKNTDKVLVRVTDNGPGIDVKHIPMVFGQYLLHQSLDKVAALEDSKESVSLLQQLGLCKHQLPVQK